MGWTDDYYDYDSDEDNRFCDIPIAQFKSLCDLYGGDLEEVWHAWVKLQDSTDTLTDQSIDLDYARNKHEEEMLLLARHIAPIPEDQRKKLIDALKTSADFYLNAMGITSEDK